MSTIQINQFESTNCDQTTGGSAAGDTCFKCGQGLSKIAKLADGKLYHTECFVCANCNAKMMKYVMKDGKWYCTLCVHTMFDAQCAMCGSWIQGMKSDQKSPVYGMGRLWHSKCLQCENCDKRIIGKFYVCAMGFVYCSDHPPKGTSDEAKKKCKEPIRIPASELEDDTQTTSVQSTKDDGSDEESSTE